jgi:CHASE3 domain sensor protein
MTELPEHVEKFLRGLDEEETDALSRILKAALSFKTAGRIILYVVGGLFAMLIIVSQAADAMKKFALWFPFK